MSVVWDFVIFFSAIIATLLKDVELGIYVSTVLSVLVLFIRIARPRVEAIGRIALTKSNPEMPKYAYVPVEHPAFATAQPPPDDVAIVHLDESLTYPNSSYTDDQIVNYVKARTRRCFENPESRGDRPWNDSGDHKESAEENAKKPQLRAVIFDMSSVTTIDSTGIQCLADIKKELNKYADRKVEYHFANIRNENIQRSLIIGGFGTIDGDSMFHAKEIMVTVQKKGEKKGDVESQYHETEHNDKAVAEVSKTKKLFHLTLEEAIDEVLPNW